MKKIIHITLTILSIVWLANWGTKETTIDGNSKQNVNFYGTLYTYQSNKPMEIDNISVGFKYRQIPMYQKPQQHPKAKPVTSPANEFTLREIQLTQEPRISLVTTKIDLSEVSEIRIPHPYVMWTYQKTQGYRKVEYIEVEVISKDAQKTKAYYLLERNIKVYCDEINPAGPVEKEVPLPAIKRLLIKGYSLRDIAPKDKSCPVCPVPAANQQPKATTPTI